MELRQYAYKLRKIDNLARAIMPDFPYHNYAHVRDVSQTANFLAKAAGLDYEDRFLLKTAAKLHDIIQVIGAKDNEEKSAVLADSVLRSLDYDSYQRKEVVSMILATKMPQKPKTMLEMLLCDADLANLGRPDFFEKGKLFRREMQIPAGKEFYDIQLIFLKSHNYHTNVANKLLLPGKKENIEKLNQLPRENYGL